MLNRNRLRVKSITWLMASEASAYKLSPMSLGKHHGGRSPEQKTAAHFMADQKAEAGNTGTVFVLFFSPLLLCQEPKPLVAPSTFKVGLPPTQLLPSGHALSHSHACASSVSEVTLHLVSRKSNHYDHFYLLQC